MSSQYENDDGDDEAFVVTPQSSSRRTQRSSREYRKSFQPIPENHYVSGAAGDESSPSTSPVPSTSNPQQRPPKPPSGVSPLPGTSPVFKTAPLSGSPPQRNGGMPSEQAMRIGINNGGGVSAPDSALGFNTSSLNFTPVAKWINEASDSEEPHFEPVEEDSVAEETDPLVYSTGGVDALTPVVGTAAAKVLCFSFYFQC